MNKTIYILFIVFGLVQTGVHAMNHDRHGRITGPVDPSSLSDEASARYWQQLKAAAMRSGQRIDAVIHTLGTDVATAQAGLAHRGAEASRLATDEASAAPELAEQLPVQLSVVWNWLKRNWTAVALVSGVAVVLKLIDRHYEPARPVAAASSGKILKFMLVE